MLDFGKIFNVIIFRARELFVFESNGRREFGAVARNGTLRGSAHSISDILSHYRVHSNALSSKTLDRVPIELTRIRHRHQHRIANANLTTNRLNDRIKFARLTACVIGSRAISYRRIRALRASKWIKPIFWLIFFIPTAPLRKFVIQQIRRRPL